MEIQGRRTIENKALGQKSHPLKALEDGMIGHHLVAKRTICVKLKGDYE